MNRLLSVTFLMLQCFAGQEIAVTTTETSFTTDEACGLNDTCGTIVDNIMTEIANATAESSTAAEMNITTSAPTTTEIPQLLEETHKHLSTKGCFCDMQRAYCDINCCCDEDCTYDNKLAFSHCMEEENRYKDTKFCDYMEYLYKNNTPYEWEVNQNGLFCIVRSNLPPQYTVQQTKVCRPHFTTKNVMFHFRK